MRGLTERQTECLDFIKAYIQSNSYPPSIREIAAHLKISIPGTNNKLLALQQKGKITRVPGIARGILVIENKLKI